MKISKLVTPGLICFGLLGFSGAASAEDWTFKDLGELSKRSTCMIRAEQAIKRYKNVYGGGSTASESWTVYGYDLEPGDQDVVIMCPIVNGDVVNAFLTVHGESSEDNREFTADTIERYWDE